MNAGQRVLHTGVVAAYTRSAGVFLIITGANIIDMVVDNPVIHMTFTLKCINQPPMQPVNAINPQ